MMEPRSKAVYLHGCDKDGDEQGAHAAFEEKRSILVCGCAYPGSESRTDAACKRALDIGVDCFLDRPSSSAIAVESIAGFINDEIYGMRDRDKIFLCSLAMLYVFKGKTRVYPAGNAAVMYFENEELKNIWYGGGSLLGSSARPELVYSDEFELVENARFVMVTGAADHAVRETVDYYKGSNGEEPENAESFVKEKHCSYVNLYLPKREKRGFLK